MTNNPDTSSASSKPGQKLKALIAQGLIGTISLAGATAVPIVIKKLLEPPVAATSPASSSPASPVSPASSASPVSPASSASPSPILAPAAIASPTVKALPQIPSVQPASETDLEGDLIEVDSYSRHDPSNNDDNNEDDRKATEKPEKRNRGKNK